MPKIGSHLNKVLQQEWNEYGEDHFIFEVLEAVTAKVRTDSTLLTIKSHSWTDSTFLT